MGAKDKAIGMVLDAAGAWVADKVWDSFTSKTPSSPPAPYHHPTPTNVPTTIPTTKPKGGALQTIKDEVIGIGAGLAMSGNQVNNTAITNYNNNINNVTNNYNNATTNNANMASQAGQLATTGSLLSVLACQCESAIALKGSIDALTATVGTGVATIGYLAETIAGSLAGLTAAVATISYTLASLDSGSKVTTTTTTPPVVNVSNVNNIDVVALVTAIQALMPQSRLDYYDKSNEISDYKLTPQPYSDAFGNDVITASPLQIKTKADVGVATSSALENSTTVEDIGLDDLTDVLEEGLTDIFKLFKFNGIADNLQEISNSISVDGDISGYTPTVNLKV